MNHQRALLQGHLAVFLMGVAGVLARVSGFEPWRTTSYRVTFGGVVLLGLWLWRGRRGQISPRKLPLYLGFGLLLSIHWYSFFQSLDLLGVVLGSALIGMEPLLIALAGMLILRERLTLKYKLSILLTLVGFFILGSGGGLGQPDLVAGVLWSIFSFAIFALLVVANRVWVQDESALWLTTVEMLGAIPLTLIMMDGPWLPADPQSWGYALLLGLPCTGIAYGLYNASMKVLSASVAGLLLSVEVSYGVVGGWLIGDGLTPRQALAIPLISNILIIDAWMYWRGRRKTQHQPLPEEREAVQQPRG